MMAFLDYINEITKTEPFRLKNIIRDRSNGVFSNKKGLHIYYKFIHIAYLSKKTNYSLERDNLKFKLIGKHYSLFYIDSLYCRLYKWRFL